MCGLEVNLYRNGENQWSHRALQDEQAVYMAVKLTVRLFTITSDFVYAEQSTTKYSETSTPASASVAPFNRATF